MIYLLVSPLEFQDVVKELATSGHGNEFAVVSDAKSLKNVRHATVLVSTNVKLYRRLGRYADDIAVCNARA